MAILGQVEVPQDLQPSLLEAPVQPTGRRAYTSTGNSVVVMDKPKAKNWLNFGIMDGDEFVPFPLGIPLDTMEPASTTGTNVAWVNGARKRNKVLKAVQIIGSKMAPGTEIPLHNIVCRLRRVNEELEVQQDQELDINDLLKLFGTPAAKAAE